VIEKVVSPTKALNDASLVILPDRYYKTGPRSYRNSFFTGEAANPTSIIQLCGSEHEGRDESQEVGSRKIGGRLCTRRFAAEEPCCGMNTVT
jgi:hypothetical protein